MNHIVHTSSITPHDHPCLELAFVLSGSVRHYGIFGNRLLKPGDVVAIPQGSWHAYRDCQNLELFNLLLFNDLLNHELSWLATLHEIPQVAYFHHNLHYQIGSWKIASSKMTALRECLEVLNDDYLSKEISRLKIVAGLLRVLSFLADKTTECSMEAMDGLTLSPIIRRAIQLMTDNLAHPWTLEELASALHLHPVSLIKFFHQGVGMPPMKYLSTRRAEFAATLLLTGQKSVAEIGAEVGWPEPKHFARAFKRYFGCSATEYREKMQ